MSTLLQNDLDAMPDGPYGLQEAYRRALLEKDRMRRIWVAQQLEVLGIDSESPAGMVALDRYSPFIDDNTMSPDQARESDWSLLRMRGWLAEEIGTFI